MGGLEHDYGYVSQLWTALALADWNRELKDASGAEVTIFIQHILGMQDRSTPKKGCDNITFSQSHRSGGEWQPILVMPGSSDENRERLVWNSTEL
jgi:hypothetical protein